MLLSELIEYITYSETGNLFLSGEEEGKIRSKHYPKVISNINMALIEMHKRFPVLVKDVTIQQYEHITDYKLHDDYAVTNTTSTETYKYIIDSASEPFNNDVLKIERVMPEQVDEDRTITEEYPLNMVDDDLSYFTPSHNILQIPYPVNDNAVFVEYRAYPKKIPVLTSDLTSIDIELPHMLLEPLLNFMNYKLYTGVGMDKPESPNYLQKYERECIKIDQLGVYNRDAALNLKLETREWV